MAKHDDTNVGHVAHIRKVMEDMGLPMLEDENFTHTPERWLRYLQSYIQPFDASSVLGVTFPLRSNNDGVYDRALVIQTGIPYRAVCAHHLLPVLGTAHVGYIPGDRVVGLSKLARLVYGYSHELPSLQEDVCHSVTAALMHHLKPLGAMCVISAEHGCMAARGVEEATGCIDTVTASVKGIFEQDNAARQEFYSLVQCAS